MPTAPRRPPPISSVGWWIRPGPGRIAFWLLRARPAPRCRPMPMPSRRRISVATAPRPPWPMRLSFPYCRMRPRRFYGWPMRQVTGSRSSSTAAARRRLCRTWCRSSNTSVWQWSISILSWSSVAASPRSGSTSSRPVIPRPSAWPKPSAARHWRHCLTTSWPGARPTTISTAWWWRPAFRRARSCWSVRWRAIYYRPSCRSRRCISVTGWPSRRSWSVASSACSACAWIRIGRARPRPRVPALRRSRPPWRLSPAWIRTACCALSMA